MRRGLPAVIACALAGAACASDEGLLVDIDVDYQTVWPDDVDTIEIWVGVPSTAGGATEFVRSEEDGRDRQPVGGWPFRMLVYADPDPRLVWVGAFAYEDGNPSPVAEGTIEGPVMVTPGVLAHRTITLAATDRAIGNCVFRPGDTNAGTEPLVIRPPFADANTLDCDNDNDPASVDCNDLDANVSTGAPERCDGIDNNCDGICDDRDLDGDLYTACTYQDGCTIACTDGSLPPADLLGGCDCDETDTAVNPMGMEVEVCDAVDSNCDGADGGMPQPGGEVSGNQIDDDCDGRCDFDEDGDLITRAPDLEGTWLTTCDPARADCDDTAPETYPNALEACDGIDTDCDGVDRLIEGRPCFVNAGGFGCEVGERTCADTLGLPGVWSPCVPMTTKRVAPSVCPIWAAVESSPWPERVLFESRPDTERTQCLLDVWRPFERNEVCPGAATQLKRRVFSDPCETFIAGAAAPDGWTLKLRTVGDNPATGPHVPSCDVELLVEAIRGAGLSDVRLPSLWVIVVQQSLDQSTLEPTQSVVTPLEIRVQYANAATSFVCPPARSLSCLEP